MFCFPRFVIGREKDPSKSEVARLIQQSLEADQRRAEELRQRQERERERERQMLEPKNSYEEEDDSDEEHTMQHYAVRMVVWCIA